MRRLRKRSLFLVINMAFADAVMLGSVSLPIYIYSLGRNFQLWKRDWSKSLSSFYIIVDMFFSQASLISAASISGERFHAVYWLFKHLKLTMRACLIRQFCLYDDVIKVASWYNSGGVIPAPKFCPSIVVFGCLARRVPVPLKEDRQSFHSKQSEMASYKMFRRILYSKSN